MSYEMHNATMMLKTKKGKTAECDGIRKRKWLFHAHECKFAKWLLRWRKAPMLDDRCPEKP